MKLESQKKTYETKEIKKMVKPQRRPNMRKKLADDEEIKLSMRLKRTNSQERFA